MAKRIPLINKRRSKRSKVRQPKILKSGYRVLRKTTRLFNNKRYNRIGAFKSEERAHLIKDKFKDKGYHALIIQSGPNYQIWIRK